MNKVKMPLFELVGPPCKDKICDGVLIDFMDLKTKDFFKKCSKCRKEFIVVFDSSKEVLE